MTTRWLAPRPDFDAPDIRSKEVGGQIEDLLFTCKGRAGGISGEGTRTLDTADMSRMLYHLSYAAMFFFRRHYSNGPPFCQPHGPSLIGGDCR